MEFFEFDNSFLGGNGDRGYGQQHSILQDESSKGSIVNNNGSTIGTVTCAQSEFYKANKGTFYGLNQQTYNCIDNMPNQVKSGDVAGPVAPTKGVAKQGKIKF